MPKPPQPVSPDHRPSGLMGGVAIGFIWIYQRTLSPAFYLIGVRCRHAPSCSHYAIGAFSKHRFGRAFWLTVSRLSRCHPFGSHGFDPVSDDTPDVGWKFWKLGDWAWTERGGAPSQAAGEKKGAAPWRRSNRQRVKDCCYFRK